MKNLSLLGAAVACLVFLDPTSMVAAKEHVIIAEDVDEKRHERPSVSALRQKRCLSDSEDTEVCVKYGGNLVIGWEWAQKYDDRRALTTSASDESFYDLALEVYSSQRVGLGFLVNIFKLIYWDIKGEMDEFKVALTLKMTYYLTSRRTCFNLLYYIDDFLFSTKMDMRFGECYKNIIKYFYDYDNWSSKYARWADECRLSSATVVEVYKFNYTVENSERYITALGDGTDTADGCKPGLFWTGGLTGTLHHNAMVYFMERMGELKNEGKTPTVDVV